MRHHRFALASAPFALALATAAEARAGSFTPEGAFLFDPNAAAVLDFEGPLPEEEPQPSEDAGALHGKSVLHLDTYGSFEVDVSVPPVRRTYRASAWIRGREAIASVEIAYSDRIDEVVALYPTGRVTSDGWVELANEKIRVDGPRLKRLIIGAYAPGGAAIDAFELVPDGGESELPAIANPTCKGVADGAVCAADQICIFNECRDVRGWVPPIPKDRDDVAAYLEARLTLLFGPFYERNEHLPSALVAIAQMKNAKDPWTYWNGFALAVRKLHDGHTTTSSVADSTYRNRRPLSVCFIEGDADLSHTAEPKDAQYLDVLVSHVAKDNVLGLVPGDRLVRIDGQHPIAWARSLIEMHWPLPPTSNPRTFAELASTLQRYIGRYASEIEILRCDPAAGTCGAPETIAVADIPVSSGMGGGGVTCDNRPLRHLADSPANHGNNADSGVYSGVVVESDAEEKIYGLEWESLYTTNGVDGVGAGLKQAVNTWKAEGARGVILDHRSGFGGTIMAPAILWSYAVPRRANDYYEDRQRGEDEMPSLEGGKAIFDAAKAKNEVNYAGSNNPETGVPVALLLTEDVSASDWLPLGMKGAPNVRIFGPFESNGAFSTRYAFGYWMGVSYVMAVGDTFLPDGATANGTGVAPDVVVLPKQSDLLAGKDTVYEAALSWVRSEIAP